MKNNFLRWPSFVFGAMGSRKSGIAWSFLLAIFLLFFYLMFHDMHTLFAINFVVVGGSCLVFIMNLFGCFLKFNLV